MELVEQKRAPSRARTNETQHLWAHSMQSIPPPASINLIPIASSGTHKYPARGYRQTTTKLIFSRRLQQDTQAKAKRGSGSLSLGSKLPRPPVVVVGLLLVMASSVASTAASAELARSIAPRSPLAMAPQLPSLHIDARHLVEMLSTNLIQSLVSLPRRPGPFTGSGGFSLTSDQRNTVDPSDRAPPPQTPLLARRPGRLMKMLSRLGKRIGARNSIRFHNAFRDLAWQLLASMSMPTPIIYELRRRQLYSPEEDHWNDSLASKNTTMTIRSKRNLEASRQSPKTAKQNHQQSEPRADDEDEEDSYKDLRARLRLRLEDLVSLSRRSLFGRVIRLPALFPFKRHQEEENDQPEGVQSLANSVQRPQLASLLPTFKLLSNKKEESSDHQRIFIDGKQYYINDEGELKELNR